MSYDFKKITGFFNVNGELISCEKYGEGHINETYLAKFDDSGTEKWYIVQKINKKLFTDISELMSNICNVTEFTREKIRERGGNPDRESLTVVYTKDGKSYKYFPEYDENFRIFKYITNAVAHQRSEKAGQFYKSALAFGKFTDLLSEFDATKLYDVLPDFHNTEKRFADFTASLKKDKCGRANSVKAEIDFVMERKNYCGRIVNLLKSGEMPTKVTHNDTKLNNVMLDADTDDPVAVIDLDTVMAGSICYDFGDSIRFGCNTAAEDEKDLKKVNFDINLFEEYTKGYLCALGKSITKIEKDNLAFGAILMTYECGMRFLADYLDGDVYFRTSRENQNLDRARTQFKLVSDMENRLTEMQDIVNKY